MEKKYSIISEKLGEGAFGFVHKVEDRRKKIFAAKFMVLGDRSATVEIGTLAHARHEHIIKLCDFGEWDWDKKIKYICLVLEFADVGTLNRAVASGVVDNQESTAWTLLMHLASALDHLHSLQPHILHRDLKPDNILGVTMGDGISWKLADFGLAKILTSDEQGRYYANSRRGTKIYMAPEVLEPRNYSFSADIWSLGAVITFVCNRQHLFTNWSKIQNWTKQATIPSDRYSVGLVNLLASMLDPEKGQRPTAAQILAIS